MVPVINGLGGQPMTYLLAASTGNVEQILPGVSNPECDDLTGDGIPDLFYLTGNPGQRKLTTLRGILPPEWRRPGNWNVAPDFDGDRQPDFLETVSPEFPNSLVARSGNGGHVLWRSRIRTASSNQPEQVLYSDLNGDGSADLIFVDLIEKHPGSVPTLAAVSGKDGKRIWMAPDFGMQNGATSSSGSGPQSDFHYPMLDLQDLDGDNRPEILVAAFIGMWNTVSLGALSSTDGRLLWKIPIHGGAYVGTSPLNRDLWHDLNGDGFLDLVLWVPESINEMGVGNGFEVRAFSGKDGAPLWKDAAYRGLGWFLWPRCPIADLDGDGTPEVFVTSADPQGQPPRELAVLNATTGALKWLWKWQAGAPSVWPPLPVDLNGNGQRMLCMAVDEKGQSPSIVIFDAAGNLQQRLALDWISQASTWTAMDVDADGTEDLIFAHQNLLKAYDLRKQKIIWQSDRGFGWRLDEVRRETAGRPGTLVGWAGRTASGINSKTGEMRWRCDIPVYDQYHVLADLSFAANHDRPAVVSHDAQRQTTLLQQAGSTDSNGRFEFAAPTPGTFKKYVPLPQNRLLPWVQPFGERSTDSNPLSKRLVRMSQLRMSELPVIAVVIGLTVFWWVSGRRRRALLYAGFTLLVTILSAGVMLAGAASPQGAGDDVYSWDGWYWAFYPGLLATGVLTLLAGICFGIVHAVRFAFGWPVRRNAVSKEGVTGP
jgi:hypothetical protein